jgi:Uma2 family endonuclease
MTEAQFVAWATRASDIRAEWVDGKVVVMSAVELAHARIVQFLTMLLGTFAEERELGEVLGEPYQIRFAKLRRRRMPDLMFISTARSRFLERMQFDGAPDLIVEVVSADSQTRDRREKFLEYQQIGVREYWIIDPLVKDVEFYTLKRGKGYVAMPVVDEQIKSIVLPGLFIRPEWFWQLRPPKVLGLLKRMGVG